MGKKKEDRPYFDENRDYVGEHEAEIVRPLSRKVVVQEKLVVQTLRKKWLRYKDAEIVYSLEHKKILEMADQVMTASTELYPGVLDSIRAFREAGYKLGIVTTKMSFRINDILKKFSAQELVDVVIGADNVKTEKPDPEGVLIAARTLGLELSRILYVGDSLVDARTAANAGVDLAAVLTGTTAREDFAPYAPKFICENIPELRSKLLQ